jgi:hypothetical protein
LADSLYTKAYNTALSMLSAGGLTTADDVERSVDAAAALLGPHHPDETLDRDQLLRDLEAALSIFQEDSAALLGEGRHVPWLDTRRQEVDWSFSERYLRYLRERENRAPAVLDRLDRVTMKILSHLEDPGRREGWDRRGLVVGGVQSGKTANYLGLICRAADAGYRLIVVLAGMHNNLRSQTQLRVDEGFLGFDTQKRQRSDSDRGDGSFSDSALGVGRLPGVSMFPVASLTTSAEDGDFRTQKAKAQVVPLGSLPVVLVVKKHSGILNKLSDWVLDAAGTGDPRKVRDFPTLVLDDEADNASISTKDPFVDGRWAPEDVDPTAVNAAIRRLLNSFERKAYVGYTATPNAIIYIPHDVDHPEYGKDLFPEDFIEYVPPPSNYFGPARLFGLDDAEDADPGADRTTLLRTINDYGTWLPDKHPNGTRPGAVPASLREAMRAFVLARAVRLARGQRTAHNSMLLHVSRFQNVQDAVKDQVRDELEDLRGRIRFGDGDGSDIRAELRELYERDFVTTTARWSTAEPVDHVIWSAVEPLLEEAVDPIEIRLINGYAKEALEYFEHRADGFNVIAIGGNKLSRGLTLEGLTVSYYLRAASTHDTLLQMGRWFGYREGYEDVCRLYTTGRLIEAFRGVTEANQELINDFLDMVQLGRTPREYGLKIQDTVPGLLVTARNKMKGARKVRIGFSGEGPSTVALYCDKLRADRNRAALTGLMAHLDQRRGATQDSSGNWFWTDVPGADVATLFFERYRSPAAAWKVQGDAIAQYIRDRLTVGELASWTVVLVSSSDPDAQWEDLGGHGVGLVRRNVLPGLRHRVNDGLYSIKQLLSPGHEAVDLTDEERARALQITVDDWRIDPRTRKTEPKTPVGWAVRRVRDRQRGLLLVYPLAPPAPSAEAERTTELATDPIVGFLASFPMSPGAPAVEYQVNRVYDELFGADDWDDQEDDEG